MPQITSHRDWIAAGEPPKCLARFGLLTIEQCFHESRDVFSPEGSHGHGQMKAVVEVGMFTPAYSVLNSAHGILAVGKPGGDIEVPVGKS
jgi:hypothetical protein